MCLRPDISGLGCDSPAMASARLAMFLARSPMRSRSPAMLSARHDLAQVVGHRLAPGDHRDDLLLDLALELIDRRGRLAMTSSASLGSRRSSASNDCAEQLLGEAAHLRDLLVEQLQLLIEGLDGVLVHGLSLRACRLATAGLGRRLGRRRLRERARSISRTGR